MGGGVAEIREINDAFAWSVSKLAECFGLHRQTLAKRINDAGLQPVGRRHGNAVYAITDVSRVLHGSGAASDADPDSMAPQDRKAWYDSELKRRALQEKDRELIPIGEVERAVATTFNAIAQTLRSVPDLIERRTGASPDILVAFEEILDAAMSSLADHLSELGPVDE